MAFVVCGVTIALADSLTIYPEYQDVVTKNTDYNITVSQGDRTEKLSVYSMCRQTGNGVHDNYRRFAEFAFDGTVEIKITSDTFNMSTAQIMPKEAASNAVYANGELTITLDKNMNIAVNVNKDYRTTIGIFAEKPETDIPDKNDPNVLYYEAGWHDTEDVLKLKSGQTMYLEPVAVLNADIRADGNDITIKGRGIIRDRLYGTAKSLTPVIRIDDKKKNIKIEDLKFFDAKTFVLVGNFKNENVTIDNVKIL